MNTRILTVISAAVITTMISSLPVEAGCKGGGACKAEAKTRTVTARKHGAVKPWGTRRRVRMTFPSVTFSSRPRRFRQDSVHVGTAAPGTARRHGNVVAIINSRASSYGVPAWFALRIANVESGYNPQARGAAGEFGVFQLKCATAKLIGYRGDCSGLLNAGTNVEYGLKHLSLAIKRSGGNLQMAASKHNGGLGYRGLVMSYVNKVF